jgi:hypothetical protein
VSGDEPEGKVVSVWEISAETIAAQYTYGDKILRADLEELLGDTVPETGTREEIESAQMRFVGFVEKVRSELLERHDMVLVRVSSGEWGILRPGNQRDYAMVRLRLGLAREIGQAENILEHTRTDLLSSEEARARTEAIGKVAALRALVHRRLDRNVQFALPEREPGKKGSP